MPAQAVTAVIQAVTARTSSCNPNPNQAGGYGIQGFAGAFVRQIHGCYHNVVGFPMHRFCEQVCP